MDRQEQGPPLSHYKINIQQLIGPSTCLVQLKNISLALEVGRSSGLGSLRGLDRRRRRGSHYGLGCLRGLGNHSGLGSLRGLGSDGSLGGLSLGGLGLGSLRSGAAGLGKDSEEGDGNNGDVGQELCARIKQARVSSG